MIRSLHRWFGLVAALLLILLALSGTALSLFPATDALKAPSAASLSVAELAARVKAAEPSVEQIRRAPSGLITAFYFKGDAPVSAIVDPATGKVAGNGDQSALQRFLTNLHRSLFLDDTGRIIAAAGALSMLLLAVTGLFLIARRAGGFRQLLKPMRGGSSATRLHATVSRLAFPGLVLSSITALWMTASTFGYLPDGAASPEFPASVSGATGIDLATLPALKAIPVDSLQSLSFPAEGDATDVFTVKTDQGEGYIDQGNGALIGWSDANFADKANRLVIALHTGRGMAWLGLLLGVSALAVPFLGVTGLMGYAQGRRGRGARSKAANKASTIILVGSEGGTTWGFAETLRAALEAAGETAHVGALSGFSPETYAKANRVILMASTYGDGEAPAPAAGFLARFAAMPVKHGLKLAILGFGDRSFAHYCGFAKDIAAVAQQRGWPLVLPFDTIDRQSPQDFARWGRELSAALGLALELNHVQSPPKTFGLTLTSRRDYGASLQANTAILRLQLPERSLWQRLTGAGFPAFEAGDLIGIIPEGSELPRYYSLASGSRDGFAEICVRKHPGGLCSGQLTSLEPGAEIRAFIRKNPHFRPQANRRPVILIGAGTGIGPLAGFARANDRHQPMYLYFGTRHPSVDALYAEELAGWQAEGRLSGVQTAFSRATNPAYVQDILKADAARLSRLLAAGGQVLVCGGREMAAGVAQVLADVLAASGLTIAGLKAEGRYAEDVY